MRQWEYKTITLQKDGGFLSSDYKDPEEKMNDLGAKGWEYVGKLPSSFIRSGGSNPPENTMVFKRPRE